jgi:hypothetical protein
MKPYEKKLRYSFILFGLLAILTNSCKKSDENKKEELPIIKTLDITDIATTTAFSGTYIIGDTSRIKIFGISWDTIPNPTFSDNCVTILKVTISSSIMMRELVQSTWYYVRAYAIVGRDTIYGDEKSFRTADTFVGDNFQGGIVAYIFKPGDPGYIEGEIHGLVISPDNLVTHDKYDPYPLTAFISWDDEVTNITTGAIGQAIGTGNSNTNAIVSVLGLGSYASIPHFYAAKLCYDLVLNGYKDWYLPSIEELERILTNHSILQLNSSYWSSTEISNSTALILTFYEQGTRYEMGKNYSIFVRAVRSF